MSIARSVNRLISFMSSKPNVMVITGLSSLVDTVCSVSVSRSGGGLLLVRLNPLVVFAAAFCSRISVRSKLDAFTVSLNVRISSPRFRSRSNLTSSGSVISVVNSRTCKPPPSVMDSTSIPTPPISNINVPPKLSIKCAPIVM